MSTVKIKTEPTAAITAAAAAVDVQVKLEHHTSDIDTKVESDSEADSEEDEVKSESGNDDAEVTDQEQRQFICDHSGCGRNYNSAGSLNRHKYEHKLQVELSVFGKTYSLTRQSLDDRWPCPILGCTSIAKAIRGVRSHIEGYHDNTMKHQHQQQPPTHMTRRSRYFIDVDIFYMNRVRCGYHNITRVFICHDCWLVPECLLTHLQQKHGYSEKSIDKSALPDSTVDASADPNINQHTNSAHLAAAIRQPHWQQHKDIIQGWLCVTSDCGYCGHTASSRRDHKIAIHQGQQLTTVPALILRLVYSKSCASCFLITRLDQARDAVTTNSNRVNRHRLDYTRDELSAQDENEDDTSQDETTDESSQKREWKCEYPKCSRRFNSSNQLSTHRREHKLEVVINVQGTTFVLRRQSLDDRWPCPVPDCKTKWQTVNTTRDHIINIHSTMLKQKRAIGEDSRNMPQQIIKRTQPSIYYLNMDCFYVNDIRCGYYTTIGVFTCHVCKLVPECLFTHLQQKHALDEKSIDNSALPESAVNAGTDPNTNQHTRNPHLAAAISQPSQPQHPDIVLGWTCVASDCGHCYSTKESRNRHQRREHKGGQKSTVPALVLRLLYRKAQASGFLITRLDSTTSNIEPSNSANQHNSECDYDDGDELVLSDYSD